MEQWRRLRIIVRQAAYSRTTPQVSGLFIPPQSLHRKKKEGRVMTIRKLLAAAILVASPIVAPADAAAPSHLSPADQMELQRVSAYLNSLQSVQGNFVQLSGDGRTARGTFYLKKPGRV